MKKISSFLITVLAIITFANAQGTWTQKANFGGASRWGAVSFSIGSKGYMGTGYNGVLYSDFWEWNPSTSAWTQRANFGGPAREFAVGFSIGTKGYIGTGGDGSSINYSDFWEYNPSGNTWTARANFPGNARDRAVGFSIGTKGYIGTGNNFGTLYGDFYEYDQTSGTWSAKANFGGTPRYAATGFSIGTKGYIGTGNDGVDKQDFYEWNQGTNTWASKTNFGGTARRYTVGLSIGSNGYIGTGTDGAYKKDFWKWDSNTNTWTQIESFGGAARYLATGFSIGSNAYLGTGFAPCITYANDFWKYNLQATSVPVCYSLASVITVNSNPRSVCSADFTNDGKMDFAVANFTSNNISVLQGDGAGGFTTVSNLTLTGGATNPRSVCSIDFNGDGNMDLASANNGSANFSVFLGNGNGTFQAGVNYGTAGGPFAITTADFNGDCKADIAVANSGGNNVSVRLGNGDGTFLALNNFSAGTAPSGISNSDFNGDGKIDLAVSNQSSNDVSILLGDGSGSFGAATNFSVGSTPGEVTSADFNSDGKMDLAVNSRTTSNVYTLPGNGNGTFGAAVSFAVSGNNYGLCSADFNLDGKMDIATANAGSNNISIIIGDGTGSFGTATNYSTGASSNPFSLCSADFNNDGRPDIATANNGTANSYVFLNSMVIITAATTNVSCFGVGNGSVTATPSGGTSPYTYSWGGGQTTSSITNLIPGNYNVTITNFEGCSATASVTISQPNILSLSSIGSTTITIGQNTTLSSTVSGGTAPYTFSWSPTAGLGCTNCIPVTATPTATTTYTLTVTDANNCTAQTSAAITVLYPPTITTFTPTSGPVGTTVTITGTNFNSSAANNIVFFGATQANVTAATGGVQLTVTAPTGGTYQYISVTDITTGLTAYSAKPFIETFPNCATIDATSFAAKVDFAIGTQPNGVAIGDLDGDGKSDVAVADYSNPGKVSTFRNTSTSGTISFAAKVDFLTGTTYASSVAIGDLDGDGKPDVAVTNGNGNNTVTVFRNTSTSGTISFAAAQSYATGGDANIVVIGDLDGDGKPELAVADGGANTVAVLRNTSASGTISFAAKVDFATGANAISVAIGDLDGDGKPDIAVANNTGNSVSVLRNTCVSGTISFSAKVDFTAGTTPYGVVIGDLDADGKPELSVANIMSNTVSILKNTSTSGVINSSSFAAKVDFTVGNGPYTVAIGDLNGDGKPDIATASGNANASSVLKNTSTTGVINSSSFAAKVDFATGTNPLSVAIGDLDGDAMADITTANGSANNFSVLRHNSCCSVTAAITTQTNVSCNGGNNGTATVTAGGGTMPYTYLWSPSGQTTSTATGLNAVTYSVSVSDANGTCTITATATLTQPATALSTTVSSTNATCGSNDGTATVAALGGTSPYTYLWSNNATTSQISNLAAQNYSVIVTDANLCTKSSTVTVNSNGPSVSISSSTNVNCFGNNTGSATANASGGTSPYTYLWNASGQTTSAASNLIAGNYTTTVTDNNGCSATATVSLTQPLSALSVSIINVVNVSCNGSNDGSATANPTGGTSPYTYSWSSSAGTNATANNLSPIVYTATITDAKGCTATQTVSITKPSTLSSIISSQTNVSCFGGSNGSVTVTAGGGTVPYTYLWNPTSQTNQTVTGLSQGSFNVTVEDAHGCVSISTGSITQPASALTSTITAQTNLLCNGGNNGSATVTAGGGTSPYTFIWNNGQSTSAATNLSSTTYSVTVSDNNGCTSSKTVSITQPAALNVVATPLQMVSCFGGNDGIASVSASGGTGSLSYTWSNGKTTTVVANLIANTYTVTVKDANNCTATQTVSITQPNAISISITPANASCDNSGSASAVVSGGTNGYSYLWNNGNTTSAITNLLSGNYSLTITDANSCSKTSIVTVGNTAPATPSICLVTVDSMSQNNLIVWDKTSYWKGDTFLIYRDTANNAYGLVGTVPYDSLSMYADTARTIYAADGNPNVTTWRYKLAVKDSCGNISAKSIYHQTIYIQNSTGNFSWNHYQIEGQIVPVPSLNNYLFQRDNLSNGNYITIQTLSASSTSYTDPNYAAFQNTATWRVKTLWSISCTPTIIDPKNPSALVVNLNSSKSNAFKTLLTSANSTSDNLGINISPNPSSGIFTINCSEKISSIEIVNIIGEKIYCGKQIQIDISNQPQGVYFMHLTTPRGVAVRKIVKE